MIRYIRTFFHCLFHVHKPGKIVYNDPSFINGNLIIYFCSDCESKIGKL